MDSVTAPQTAQPPEYRGLSRAQADFAAMNARQSAATGGDQDFSFADFVDLINPLQHLPVIGDLYRDATGDEIKPAVKVAGDGVWGGPIGLVSGAFHAIYEAASGENITQTVAGWFGGGAEPAHEIQLADIQWNPPSAFNLAATPLPDQQKVAASAQPAAPQAKPLEQPQVAAAEPPKPSALYTSLQKGVIPSSYSPPPQIPSHFKPNKAQFEGMAPAAMKTPAANDSTEPAQNDFAKKMMEALDRYEASKKIAAPAAAPVVNEGL